MLLQLERIVTCLHYVWEYQVYFHYNKIEIYILNIMVVFIERFFQSYFNIGVWNILRHGYYIF